MISKPETNLSVMKHGFKSNCTSTINLVKEFVEK